uniref:Nucleolar complex protein 4 homolog B-like n=1 Tax=Phallusia mammillata TaxID=59560 RepID=A0A6F9DMN3_9ASCI|nr:nucleolar complex protein 4 homolog B-like [Phallusia mammillata]
MTKINVKQLVVTALHSKEHANNIVDLIDLIATQRNRKIVLEAASGCLDIFTKYLEEDCLPSNTKSDDTIQVFQSWIWERITDCFNACLSNLKESDDGEKMLETILRLIQFKAICQNKNATEFIFPEEELAKLMGVVLASKNPTLLQTFTELLPYDDTRYFVLKSLPATLNKLLNADKTIIETVFNFLKTTVSFMPTDDSKLTSSYVFGSENEPVLAKFQSSRPFMVSHHRKKFSSAWLEFLKHPLPGHIHKNVLVIFHTSLVPNFAKPRLLADFLMRSYAKGGGLALLGLHGLFVLMHQHNLEYPEFYKNVYAMLHPRIFDAKYKARFFHLLDLFLSSTHIPSYLVAAFVKKMSRLCLIAPPDGICIMVTLILNLLRRHPSIRHLVHKDLDKAEAIVDPYVEGEPDPSKCAAMESSLWEVSSLKSHYSPEVVKCVSFKSIGTMETDVGEILENNYDELFNDACSKEFKNFAMNHVPPETLFGGFEDTTSEIWCVE